jgi:signal transduction histidine kinase
VSIEEKDGKKFLKIEVKDTGIGIKTEDQDKLFKLFGFLQGTEKLNKNGIGLGLVIAKNIVEKFGGKINFESIYKEGSQFSCTFQLSDSIEMDYQDDEDI